MIEALIVLFVVAYTFIALESPLRVNKSAVALVGAGLLWAVYAMSRGHPDLVDEQLGESLIGTAQIVFFLIGAMTVVEIIDAHDGFDIITTRLRAKTLATLAIFISVVTFFLSAVLDNLTSTLVMVSLLRRLLHERDDRLLLAGLVIIAANAGGAWSPIGDVTTTMLWIGGQVTTGAIVSRLFVPSLVNLAVPLAVVAWKLRGKPIVAPVGSAEEAAASPLATLTPRREKIAMFWLGVAALLFVPVFKSITHLPPFVGILLGLGVMWTVGDVLHRNKPEDERRRVTIAHALARIDMAAIVFFIGILLAVATLEHAGVLVAMAHWLDRTVGRLDLIVIAFGLVSAIVDNVPMVAAAMGMYSLQTYPTDSFLWEFMAYCAGTGGSILIIGSAAGVAAMGIERIDFGWYAKRFGLLATAGYLAGAGVYILQNLIFI
jgi:Na+/H+ antiporter NhaD/arsenite permease-like protein